MANCIIVLGKSGTGKSTSIKGLVPSETVVFNTLNKHLPFKGANTQYVEGKNLMAVKSYQDVINLLVEIGKGTKIKNIVIDDAMYIMRKEYFARAKESGYGKYTELASHFQQIISTCESLRKDLNIFFMMQSEDVISDGIIIGYKVSTIGKLLDTQYNPIEVVGIVLYSAISYDEKGKAKYGFYTHAMKSNNIEIPAKSPDGMFDADFIENDLGKVVMAINEFYK